MKDLPEVLVYLFLGSFAVCLPFYLLNFLYRVLCKSWDNRSRGLNSRTGEGK